MKKIITLVVLTLALNVSNSFAQEGAYLNVYGGYNFPASSVANWSASAVSGTDSNAVVVENAINWYDYDSRLSVVETPAGEPDTTVLNTNTKAVDLNLGKGVTFGVSFGYMFNDHFGAELGLGYFMGSKNTFENKHVDEQVGDNNTTSTGSMYANQIRFNPQLVVSSDFKDFMPYAKFGLIIGVGTKVTEEYTDSYFDAGTMTNIKIDQTFESKGGISLGANATLGALYNFNKKTGIFLEMQLTAMSYSPKQRELTVYTTNGYDEFNAKKFPNSARLIEYVKEVNYTDAEPVDPTLSTQQTKIKYPFSTLALNLGLRFSF